MPPVHGLTICCELEFITAIHVTPAEAVLEKKGDANAFHAMVITRAKERFRTAMTARKLKVADRSGRKDENEYREWNIAGDGSLHLDLESQSFISEIPGLNVIEYNSDTFQVTGLRDIEKAISALRATFDWIYLNTSTGLHVHVGASTPWTGYGHARVRGDNIGFEIDSLRKLVLLLITSSHVVDTHHESHRVQVNEYCQPFINYMLTGVLTQNSTEEEVNKALYWLHEQIYGAKTVEDLTKFVHSSDGSSDSDSWDKYLAYNIIPLLSSSKTVEFRQHAGSLNSRVIGRWIGIVTALVDAAKRYDWDRKGTLSSCQSCEELLTKLGCAHVFQGSLAVDAEDED